MRFIACINDHCNSGYMISNARSTNQRARKMLETLAIKSELMKRRTLKTKKICQENCLNKRNFHKKKR